MINLVRLVLGGVTALMRASNKRSMEELRKTIDEKCKSDPKFREEWEREQLRQKSRK